MIRSLALILALEDKVIKKCNQKNSGNKSGNRINHEIKGVSEVRLIDDDGEPLGVKSLSAAQKMAYERELDLVEISPKASPPVCKIMDHGKFLFEKQKLLKEQKKKQKNSQLKEVKFRPSTDKNDYEVKLRSLKKFLESGDKAKVTLRFRGREINYQEKYLQVLTQVKEDLEDCAIVESFPKLEGRQAIMVLAPKKK